MAHTHTHTVTALNRLNFSEVTASGSSAVRTGVCVSAFMCVLWLLHKTLQMFTCRVVWSDVCVDTHDTNRHKVSVGGRAPVQGLKPAV